MKWQIKAKRWITKNVLGQKRTSSRPKRAKQELVQVKPKVVYQQQQEVIEVPSQTYTVRGLDMKTMGMVITVVIFALGVMVYWLNNSVSPTAALVALAMVGMFLFNTVKDFMDVWKLREHNRSQQITTEMLTEYKRADAMTDNYRQKTTLENARLQRQQLSYDQEQIRSQRQQLMLEQKNRQNQQWIEQDDESDIYDYNAVKFNYHE